MLGIADEQNAAAADTIEAWGRSADNPVGGWYGIKKGLRGRFGIYLPPVLEALGLAELEHNARNNRMRARSTALRFHVDRRIAAPPDRVWALLIDLPSWQVWNPTVTSIDGEIVMGGNVRLVATANPKRTFVVRVTEFVPPQRMVWVGGLPRGIFQGNPDLYVGSRRRRRGTEFAMTEVYSGALAGVIGRSIPDLGPVVRVVCRRAQGCRRARRRTNLARATPGRVTDTPVIDMTRVEDPVWLPVAFGSLMVQTTRPDVMLEVDS